MLKPRPVRGCDGRGENSKFELNCRGAIAIILLKHSGSSAGARANAMCNMWFGLRSTVGRLWTG